MHTSIKAALGAAVVALAGLGQAADASAGEGYVVVNTNRSRYIEQVWIAHAGESDPWKRATMTRTIAPRSAASFSLSGAGSCYIDVKVKFNDGYEQTFDSVNACRRTRLIAS